MILSEGQFTAELAAFLDIEPSELRATARLTEDLLLDSIQMFEICLMLEETNDEELPEALISNLITVADVYDQYRLCAERRDGS